MENAHRHTLIPYFGFRYKLTKVYSFCLLRIFLSLFSNVLTNSNFFILSSFSKSTPPLFHFSRAPRCLTASRCSASFAVSFAASCSSACGISLFRLTTSRVRLALCFFFCCSGAFFCRWLVLLLPTLHSLTFSMFSIPTKSLPSLQKNIATCSQRPNNHHIIKSRVAVRATLLPLLLPNKNQAKTTAFLSIPNGNYQQTTNTHTASHKASGTILRHILAHFNTA